MKMGRRVAFIGMTILISSFIFVTVGVQAKKTAIEFDFTFDLHVSGEAAKMWETPSGIWHIRDTPLIGSFNLSDLGTVGVMSYTGSLNLFDDLMAPITFNSVGWGIVTFDGTLCEETAGFTGLLNFKINIFWGVSKMVCRGSGYFEGMLVKVTYEGWLGGIYTAHLVAH